METETVGRVFIERRLRVFYVSLVLANMGAPFGIFFALQRGRPSFFALTTVLVAGIIMADALVLVSKGTRLRDISPLEYGRSDGTQIAKAVSGDTPSILRDVRLPVSVLLLGIFVLTVIGRGGLWYLSMTAFFFLMVVRIYFNDYDRQPVGIDVVLLMIGAGSLIASQTLTVTYYAVTRDTIYHSAVATRIANYGLDSVAGTRYDDLQVYHILVATGLGMANISARLFASVLFAVVFPVVVPLALEVTRELKFAAPFGLLAGITLAVNPEFISWGSQAHPQSLSFVFFAFFLLLLVERTDHRRSLFLSLLLSVIWAMTHHLSLFMALALTAVPVGLIAMQRMAALARGASDWSEESSVKSDVLKYVVLAAGTLFYWQDIGVTKEAEQWLFEFSPAASGVETTESLIVTYDDPVTLFQQSIPTLFADLHYGIWLAFAALGIWTLIKLPRVSTRHIYVVLLTVLAATVFYFPNPTWIPLRGIAFLPRWGIMTLPFVAVAVALALEQLRQTVLRRRTTILPVVMIVLLLTVSISSGFSDPSAADIAGYEKGERKYLSANDRAAYSHTMTYSNMEQEISSGGILNNYFSLQDWVRRPSETQHLGPWTDRYNRIGVNDKEIQAEEGLTVFQKAAFEEKGLKFAVENPDSEAYEGTGDIEINAVFSDEDVAWHGDSKSIVYSNGETEVAYQDSPVDV